MNEDLARIKELEAIRAYHKELDDKIDHEALDEFTKRRLKNERLHVRDKMYMLEAIVYPDIIA